MTKVDATDCASADPILTSTVAEGASAGARAESKGVSEVESSAGVRRMTTEVIEEGSKMAAAMLYEHSESQFARVQAHLGQ